MTRVTAHMSAFYPSRKKDRQPENLKKKPTKISFEIFVVSFLSMNIGIPITYIGQKPLIVLETARNSNNIVFLLLLFLKPDMNHKQWPILHVADIFWTRHLCQDLFCEIELQISLPYSPATIHRVKRKLDSSRGQQAAYLCSILYIYYLFSFDSLI